MHSIVTTFRGAVIKVEVANFCAAMDTLIDQDGGHIWYSVWHLPYIGHSLCLLYCPCTGSYHSTCHTTSCFQQSPQQGTCMLGRKAIWCIMGREGKQHDALWEGKESNMMHYGKGRKAAWCIMEREGKQHDALWEGKESNMMHYGKGRKAIWCIMGRKTTHTCILWRNTSRDLAQLSIVTCTVKADWAILVQLYISWASGLDKR